MKGTLIPIGLLLLVLIGYGGYILYSRPTHAKKAIENYIQASKVAIEAEKAKHVKDNQAGESLMKFVYPTLMLIAALALFFISSPYDQGVALGCILLAVATYIIDYGFVFCSNAFLAFLDNL